MKPILPILALVLLCAGRTPGHIQPDDMSNLSVGMPKADVVRALGKPETVSADAGGDESLTYIVERPWWQTKTIHVHLKRGVVAEFGE